MPHPWACTPCLVLFLVLIVMTLCECVDGVFQPLCCIDAIKGGWVHSLGMLPSCPILAQTQPKSLSSVTREKGCVPPWDCMSPLCPKVLLQMPITQFISQLITSPLFYSFVSSLNIPKENSCLMGVIEGLTSSPTKLVVIRKTSTPFAIYSNPFQTLESCPHISTRTHISPNYPLCWVFPSNGQSAHTLDLYPS